jgi:hypothetical protein
MYQQKNYGFILALSLSENFYADILWIGQKRELILLAIAGIQFVADGVTKILMPHLMKTTTSIL